MEAPHFHGICIPVRGKTGHKQANKYMSKIILDSGPYYEDMKWGDEMENDGGEAGWKEAWGS